MWTKIWPIKTHAPAHRTLRAEHGKLKVGKCKQSYWINTCILRWNIINTQWLALVIELSNTLKVIVYYRFATDWKINAHMAKLLLLWEHLWHCVMTHVTCVWKCSSSKYRTRLKGLSVFIVCTCMYIYDRFKSSLELVLLLFVHVCIFMTDLKSL